MQHLKRACPLTPSLESLELDAAAQAYEKDEPHGECTARRRPKARAARGGPSAPFHARGGAGGGWRCTQRADRPLSCAAAGGGGAARMMMTVMMVMAGGVRESDAGEARRWTPERHAASALPRAPRSRLLGRRSPSPPGPLLLTSG